MRGDLWNFIDFARNSLKNQIIRLPSPAHLYRAVHMVSKGDQGLIAKPGGGDGCGCCRIWKKLNRGLGDDELKGLGSAVNYFHRNAAIQRGEFPLIVDSQSQEIDVRDLSVGNDGIRRKDF